MKKSVTNRYIYVIIVVAFLLRIPGIYDGLPAVYNSTEHFLAKIALGMGATKTIDPEIYIYPTFYTYFLFLLFSCLYLIGYLLGTFGTIYDFAVRFLIDPTVFYALARTVNVGLSLATIYILYKSLKSHFSEQVATIAAALMAVSFYMIRFSMFATADTLLIFFSTLAILYFYFLERSIKLRTYFYAGLFSGLAIAAKYNAGFLVVGLLIAVFQYRRTQESNIWAVFGSSLGGVAIGFFITNPLWLVYPQRFYQGWQLISAQMYSAVSSEHGVPFLWEMFKLIQDELVIGFLFILSTLYFLFRAEKKDYPGLVVIVLTFLFVGTWKKKGIDYLFVAYPAWIIITSVFIDQLFRKFIRRQSLKIVILLFIFTPSFIVALHQSILYINNDTREKATEWLIANIDHKQKICYDNSHNDFGVFDIQKYLSYGASVAKLPDIVRQKLQAFSKDPRQINFIPIIISSPSNTLRTDNPYEAEASQYKRRSLNELIQLNTTFLISNSWYYQSFLSVNLKDYPPRIQTGIKEVQIFYQQLLQNYKPVKVFSPDLWTSGPEISIYVLNEKRQIEE